MAKEAPNAIVGHHTVAGHLGGIGIAAKSLTYSLSASTTYSPGQFTIRNSSTAWHLEQFKVHAALKVCDVRVVEDPIADVLH